MEPSPFINFRFEVLFTLRSALNGMSNPVCSGAFSECSGLGMTMQVESFNQGGANQQQTHLRGTVQYSQLTLQRGMTSNQHLRLWMDAAGTAGINARADGTIIMRNADGSDAATFKLMDCLPVSYTAPSFNALNGDVAIEQMQIAYGRLVVQEGGGLAAGGSVSFASGFSVGASANANLSVSGGASVSAGGGIGAGFSLD